MTMHEIKIRSWSNRPVVVCETCRRDPISTDPEFALLRGDAGGLAFSEVTAAIEAHTGEGAFRAGSAWQNPPTPAEWPDAQVVTGEPDLVAYGPVDQHPAGFHPRTGQQLDPGTGYERGSYPQAEGRTGDPLVDYLEAKAEGGRPEW